MKFILGKKQGMSQVFDEQGEITPVTVIKAGPCFVVQIKQQKPDGYQAVKLGFNSLKEKNKKSKSYKYIREFRVVEEKNLNLKLGDKISVDLFSKGDKVNVSGISKGKGFQGVVKRHGFSGGPASHGHRHVLRTPGSIGSAFPQRVVKGRKMPGHTGAEQKTVTNLEIMKVDKDNDLLAVKGAIPGPIGGLVKIKGK